MVYLSFNLLLNGRDNLIFYPAIDIKDGKCIRLTQGSLKKEKIYNSNPIKQAKEFEKDGAKWIHVVDIEGAFEGKPKNEKTVVDITKNTKSKIQLGGGIRSLETIDLLISKGISRIVLGTVAITQPETVKKACRLYPEKIAIGIDSNNNKVAIEGWVKSSKFSEFEIIKKYEDLGAKYFIYTDISRDGLLVGQNLERLEEILNFTRANIIVSGGVSCLDDLHKLNQIKKKNLNGVICGKALYEKRVSVQNAIGILEKNIEC